MMNFGIRNGLQVVLGDPLVEGTWGVVMNPAAQSSHFVELNPSSRDVLDSNRAHLLLVGQVQERLVIDESGEGVLLHVKAKGNFPLCFIILNYQREHVLVCKSFPAQKAHQTGQTLSI